MCNNSGSLEPCGEFDAEGNPTLGEEPIIGWKGDAHMLAFNHPNSNRRSLRAECSKESFGTLACMHLDVSSTVEPTATPTKLPEIITPKPSQLRASREKVLQGRMSVLNATKRKEVPPREPRRLAVVMVFVLPVQVAIRASMLYALLINMRIIPLCNVLVFIIENEPTENFHKRRNRPFESIDLSPLSAVTTAPPTTPRPSFFPTTSPSFGSTPTVSKDTTGPPTFVADRASKSHFGLTRSVPISQKRRNPIGVIV
eukprot:scaffold221_cov189-Alexandrium_tamarense.AAC.3